MAIRTIIDHDLIRIKSDNKEIMSLNSEPQVSDAIACAPLPTSSKGKLDFIAGLILNNQEFAVMMFNVSKKRSIIYKYNSLCDKWEKMLKEAVPTSWLDGSTQIHSLVIDRKTKRLFIRLRHYQYKTDNVMIVDKKGHFISGHPANGELVNANGVIHNLAIYDRCIEHRIWNEEIQRWMPVLGTNRESFEGQVCNWQYLDDSIPFVTDNISISLVYVPSKSMILMFCGLKYPIAREDRGIRRPSPALGIWRYHVIQGIWDRVVLKDFSFLECSTVLSNDEQYVVVWKSTKLYIVDITHDDMYTLRKCTFRSPETWKPNLLAKSTVSFELLLVTGWIRKQQQSVPSAIAKIIWDYGMCRIEMIHFISNPKRKSRKHQAISLSDILLHSQPSKQARSDNSGPWLEV